MVKMSDGLTAAEEECEYIGPGIKDSNPVDCVVSHDDDYSEYEDLEARILYLEGLVQKASRNLEDCRRIANAVKREIIDKHQMDVMEDKYLNPSYHLEITLTVEECQVLIAAARWPKTC